MRETHSIYWHHFLRPVGLQQGLQEMQASPVDSGSSASEGIPELDGKLGLNALYVPSNFKIILWFHPFLMGFLWLTLKSEHRSDCSQTPVHDLWLDTESSMGNRDNYLGNCKANQHTCLLLPPRGRNGGSHLSRGPWIVCPLVNLEDENWAS